MLIEESSVPTSIATKQNHTHHHAYSKTPTCCTHTNIHTPTTVHSYSSGRANAEKHVEIPITIPPPFSINEAIHLTGRCCPHKCSPVTRSGMTLLWFSMNIAFCVDSVIAWIPPTFSPMGKTVQANLRSFGEMKVYLFFIHEVGRR